MKSFVSCNQILWKPKCKFKPSIWKFQIVFFIVLIAAALCLAEDAKTTEKRGLGYGLGYGAYPYQAGFGHGYYGSGLGYGHAAAGYPGYGSYLGYGGYQAGYHAGYPGYGFAGYGHHLLH